MQHFLFHCHACYHTTWKFLLIRYIVNLKRILSGKLHTLPYHESKTWGSSCIESNTIFIKIRHYLCIWFFGALFLRIIHRWFSWFYGPGVRIPSIRACFHLLPPPASTFQSMTLQSACCAFFKIALLSLIVIHVCISAFVWPDTGSPKLCAVALVVQQPLKVWSQNLQTAIFTPPL